MVKNMAIIRLSVGVFWLISGLEKLLKNSTIINSAEKSMQQTFKSQLLES